MTLALNEKGQCPKCLIKPLTYKRQGKYFCHRCNRDYAMDEAKQQIDSWAWKRDADGIFQATYPNSRSGYAKR